VLAVWTWMWAMNACAVGPPALRVPTVPRMKLEGACLVMPAGAVIGPLVECRCWSRY
jgi:hypothetical protein